MYRIVYVLCMCVCMDVYTCMYAHMVVGIDTISHSYT